MRVLNRTAGRLSRHRRGPLAGLAVLLLGPADQRLPLHRLRAGPGREPGQRDRAGRQGKELFLASCAFCHGKNGEGIPTVRDGYQIGPSLVGVGAAAVDFQVGTGRMPMASPGAQAPRKKVVFNDEEIAALAAYVASLGARPGHPRRVGLLDRGPVGGGARGGDLPRRPDLPDQLHGLPQLQRRRRRDAARRLRPVAARRRGQVHLRGAADRAAGHAQLQQRQPLARGEARRHRLPRQHPGHPGVRRLHPRRARPVSEGLFAWLVGIGGLVGAAVWIASHTTRSKKSKVDA